jgi:hypothetical protein
LQDRPEGDSFLRDFKAVKHFPALRHTATRSSQIEDVKSHTFDGKYPRSSRKKSSNAPLPPSQRRMQENFRRSVLKDGPGESSLSAFRGSLISERLKAKEKLLLKEEITSSKSMKTIYSL